MRGYAGPGVNQAQMEQRVINPDLVDTEIGRRDIRAVPGPLTPAPKGGYSSSLTFEGDQFTATYVFNDPAVALTAYARAEDRVRALAAGYNLHVAKPVEPAELALVIANLTKTMNAE